MWLGFGLSVVAWVWLTAILNGDNIIWALNQIKSANRKVLIGRLNNLFCHIIIFLGIILMPCA